MFSFFFLRVFQDVFPFPKCFSFCHLLYFSFSVQCSFSSLIGFLLISFHFSFSNIFSILRAAVKRREFRDQCSACGGQLRATTKRARVLNVCACVAQGRWHAINHVCYAWSDGASAPREHRAEPATGARFVRPCITHMMDATGALRSPTDKRATYAPAFNPHSCVFRWWGLTTEGCPDFALADAVRHSSPESTNVRCECALHECAGKTCVR